MSAYLGQSVDKGPTEARVDRLPFGLSTNYARGGGAAASNGIFCRRIGGQPFDKCVGGPLVDRLVQSVDSGGRPGGLLQKRTRSTSRPGKNHRPEAPGTALGSPAKPHGSTPEGTRIYGAVSNPMKTWDCGMDCAKNI